MAEWNPMEDSPADAGPQENEQWAMWGMSNLHPEMSKEDYDRLLRDLDRKYTKDPPWVPKFDTWLDLSWYKPTCSLEDWKHTDVKIFLGTGIIHVTLNRPDESNTLSDGLMAGLCDVLFLLHGRPDIRVAVFTGAGKMFCAGRDPKGDRRGFSIKPAPEAQQTLQAEAAEALAWGAFPDDKIDIARMLQPKFWQVWAALPQFTICFANGSATGDGMGCMCVCDMTISLRSAFFSFSETKVGFVNAVVIPMVLARARAGDVKNMVALGKILTAEEAYKMRLVDRVVDTPAEAHQLIMDTCAEISKCCPSAVAKAKELATSLAGSQVTEDAIFHTLRVQAQARGSEAAKLALGGQKPWELTPIVPLESGYL